MENKDNKKYNFIYRQFLNSENYHTTAAVVAKISEAEFGDYPNCEFNISDCTRTIFLDMDAYSEADVNNSLYKMDILIEAAQKMKEALLKVKPHVIEEEKRRAEKKLQREKEKENENKEA